MNNPLRHALGASLALLMCSIAIIISGSHSLAHASDAGAQSRGAQLFRSSGCERCHMVTGIGGDRGPDLSEVGQRRSARQIRDQIARGGHGMPPFKDVITKKDIKDLAAFLTTCRTATSPGCRQWTQ